MSENLGTIEYIIKADTAQLLTADKEVTKATDNMEDGFGAADDAAQSLSSSLGELSKIAAAVMAILSVNQVSQYADAWTELNNKLANALRPNEELVDVTERVFNITQQTRSSLEATASLYARLERATRQYGTSAEDLVKLTTIINQGFVVSGASAEEAENAIIQLSQGLASGALRGEEFNSVNENGNRLIIALADSLGVTIGQMRQLAAEGKLTTDVVVNGLLSQGESIGLEFAKTTTTISQAMQVAGNNITKFFGESSSVKTTVAIFNTAIIAMSDNIGGLSAVLTAVAALMGSRYVGALTMATTAKIKAALASREQAVAENQAAQAAALKATSDLRAATIAKDRALDEVRLAQMMKAAAANSTSLAAAEVRLSAARIEAATATDNYNRALAANTTAQTAATAAADRAAITIRTLGARALGLIGGPAGLAMLAASAIIYFAQRAKEAKDEANKLADSVNELGAKFQAMSNAELAATIGKLSQNLPTLSDAVADAQKEFNDATAAVQRQEREIANWGTNTTRGRQAAEALGGAQDKLAIAALELERAQNRLSQTQNAINIGRATLNGTMRQGIDLLRRDGEEAGVAAGMMGKLGDMINFAANAKDKFNSSSLMVERPKDVQDYLDKLQDQVTLQSELNDRKRAQLRAEQDIRKLGGSEADVRLARERAAAEYDAQQAQQKGKKVTKDATSEAAKSATAMQSNAQKIADYKQRAGLAATTTQELSREQAILRAEQSLNTSATKEQIADIRKYAAAEWDAANALKKRQQSEQAKKFTDQVNAEYKVTPNAVTGAVLDPAAQINAEETEKLAALNRYQQMGVLSVQQYEDAKTAIQLTASNARKKIAVDEANAQVAAMGSLLGSVSQGFESLASIIANSSGKSAGAYTAMFAAAKAFAVAQSTLSLNTAIMQAMADPTALTPAQKLANYAAIASAGASLLSNIASISMSGGRRYGGTVSAGNAYRINEDGRSEIFQTAGGQQAFIPNQSGKIIPADKAGGGGGVVQHITFEINTTGGIDDATMAQIVQKMKQVTLFHINDQASRPGGLIQPRTKR
ncbi:tape measure protein [Enterobacter hormaechei]|uniref:tape measure protein n=1 Tax=Enterobacter hormaechei TaxID=158836 RepID=UPI0007A8AFA0|nr:tape measure protein [Enterobacter hormaechei]SAJ27493.1 lambda family phage tail tape measure protein [Enterobacter hormaechei]HCR0070542.1 tape measure protein [Enterobacter hormaechei]